MADGRRLTQEIRASRNALLIADFCNKIVPLSDIRIVERMTVFSGEVLEIRPALRLDSRGLSPLNQRTTILASRAKRLIARDRRYDLVVVPRPTRFDRRLHFHKIHVVHHSTIFAELAVLGEEIIDRHLAHFGHHRFCFVRASGLDGAQIVARGGVDGRMGRSRHTLMDGEEAFRPSATFVITVPENAVAN